MSVHIYHPDTHTHGLADGCPRCDEHAEHPFESLDSQNLNALIVRVNHDLDARSDNERRAMNVVANMIRNAKRIGVL